MPYTKRRDFIKQSGLAVAGIAIGNSLPFGGDAGNLKLSFSTLGCPKWDLPAVVQFAAANGYQGIEIRVIAGEMDLPKVKYFSAANLADTKRMVAGNNLVVAGIGSSAQLHHRDKAPKEKNLDEGKRFIDLAHQLDCRYVRVFPEKLLPGEERKKSLDTIVENLSLLGDYAKESSVTVLMESHGDVVDADDLLYVMSHTKNHNAGMIWDIVNMWSVTKQAPADVFKKLQNYIYHVHVKDVVWENGKMKYVLIGKGVAPVKEAVSVLDKASFKGFYSFEWEKLWHPEIEEPELALAAYPGNIRSLLANR